MNIKTTDLVILKSFIRIHLQYLYGFILDYAAALTTAVPKCFWYLFARQKSPKVSGLEADSSKGRQVSIIFHEFFNQKVGEKIFQKFWHTCPSKPGTFTVIELMVPRPAPPGSGAPGEKPKPHGPTIYGHDKKFSCAS